MLPPSPRAKRATNETAPNAMSSRRTQLNGVSSALRRGSNSTWPWWACLDAADASATACARFRKKAYAAPSRAPTAITAGGTAPSAVLVKAGNGFSPYVGKPSFSNGTRRQVQHARPAQFLLAVDVVDVLVGPVGDALVRERQHLVARAVAQGVGRARLDAGGNRHGVGELLGRFERQRLPVERDRRRLRGAVGAVRALGDLRRARVPIRGRHVPGTRQHAVPAADAVVDVVRHRTVGLPVERRRRARGDAGRLQAVEAPLHDEGRFHASRLLRVLELVERDERERLRAERRRVLEAQVGPRSSVCSPSLLVPLLARHLARPAADAVGDVDQRRPDRARRSRLASCASPRCSGSVVWPGDRP